VAQLQPEIQPSNRKREDETNSTTQSEVTSNKNSTTAMLANAALVHRYNLPEPKLQNIVSTANLQSQLDLREIALKAKNAEYNPKRFAAVIMRIREPDKSTALIFSSGKMVCTGAKSEELSQTAARSYAKIVKRIGYSKVKLTDFKIQNIVGSSEVSFSISLEGLSNSKDYKKFSRYEPEQFPGLIFRMHNPKIVLLIFVSGKIVLTGAKTK